MPTREVQTGWSGIQGLSSVSFLSLQTHPGPARYTLGSTPVVLNPSKILQSLAAFLKKKKTEAQMEPPEIGR